MSSTELSSVSRNYLEVYDTAVEQMIRLTNAVGESDSITKTFVYQMIPHAMAAIEISQNLLRSTTFIPLQNIAENTVRRKTRELSDMRWLQSHCECVKNSESDIQKYSHAAARILEDTAGAMTSARRSNAINANFISEMIPHHLGGIRMARCALGFPVCDALVPILHKAIKADADEVQIMRRLYRYAVC